MTNIINNIKQILNKSTSKISNNSPLSYKALILFILHIGAAILLTYVITMFLIYVGFVSHITTQSLTFFWQKLNSYLLPTIILILSFLVITLINPIYSLICLILVFFSTVLFLLSIQVNFLALIYLIIYIGAIAILFLFVIMMFNLRELKQYSKDINDFSFISISFSCYFLLIWKFYALVLDYVFTYVAYDKYFNDLAKPNLENLNHFLTYQHTDALLFGTLLYEYYSYLFIVAGLILLTSMLGSIILALSTTEELTTST